MEYYSEKDFEDFEVFKKKMDEVEEYLESAISSMDDIKLTDSPKIDPDQKERILSISNRLDNIYGEVMDEVGYIAEQFQEIEEQLDSKDN